MPADIDLNPSLAPDRAGLIMFDALNGYLHPSDPVKEQHLKDWKIRENMSRLVKGAHDHGMTIFYASGDHAADGADIATRLTDTDMELRPWNERDRTFNPSSRHGSQAAEIAPEVAPGPGDVLIPKHRWSAFHQTHLELQLRTRGLKTVIIAGGSTDVGIVSTAFAARDLDFGIVIVRDCCYSHRDGNNDFLINRLLPRMARLLTCDEVIQLMN
jgi:nicotinamidase-related amidase